MLIDAWFYFAISKANTHKKNCRWRRHHCVNEKENKAFADVSPLQTPKVLSELSG